MATASATEFNGIQGAKGRRMFFAEVALTAGTATVTTPLTKVDAAFAQYQTGAAVSLGVSASGSTVAISDNGTGGTETVYVFAIGY